MCLFCRAAVASYCVECTASRVTYRSCREETIRITFQDQDKYPGRSSRKDQKAGLAEAPYSHTIEFPSNHTGNIEIFLKRIYKVWITMGLRSSSTKQMITILETCADSELLSIGAVPEK